MKYNTLKGRCEALEYKVAKLGEEGSLHFLTHKQTGTIFLEKQPAYRCLGTTNSDKCIKKAIKVNIPMQDREGPW